VKSMQRVLIDILNAPFEVDLPYPVASGTDPHLAQFSSTSRRKSEKRRYQPRLSPLTQKRAKPCGAAGRKYRWTSRSAIASTAVFVRFYGRTRRKGFLVRSETATLRDDAGA
jgi:hypothetical protein